MLREITAVRQIDGEPRRRWFSDQSMDLIIWLGGDKEIIGFQLAYAKDSSERAVTWRQGRGYSHDRVDDGARGGPGGYPATPILVTDGGFAVEAVAADFRRRGRELEPAIREFVAAKLGAYSSAPAAEAVVAKASSGPVLIRRPLFMAIILLLAIFIAVVWLAGR